MVEEYQLADGDSLRAGYQRLVEQSGGRWKCRQGDSHAGTR
jgi:hypothetical protein